MAIFFIHSFLIIVMNIQPVSTLSIKKHFNIKNNFRKIAFSGKNFEDVYTPTQFTLADFARANYPLDFMEAYLKYGNNFDPNFINPVTHKHAILEILNKKHLNLLEAKTYILNKMILHPDFNPNYRENEFEPPLLYQISKLKPKIFRYNEGTLYEVMRLISDNVNFNPNEVISFAPTKRRPNGEKIAFWELAIKDKNPRLLRNILIHPFFNDPYDDDFKTIEKLTSNKKCILAIEGVRSAKKLRSTIAEAMRATDITKDIQASGTPEKLSHKDIPSKLEKYYVQPSKFIPDNIEKVGGLQKAKQDIENFIINPWQKENKIKIKENNIEMPNGFLMYGPPGCGKTYIAQVIAKQTGFPLFEVNLANAGGSLGHSTEHEYERIFGELTALYSRTRVPSILFLDEIDSICSTREKGKTDWKKDEVNTLIRLLNRTSEKGIILIGATNLIENIDKAVLRTGRFDKKIEIALPTYQERKEILETLVNSKKITQGLLTHIDEITKLTEGCTCSDLNALINTCGRAAIYANKYCIDINDFQNALVELNLINRKNDTRIGF